MARHVSGPDSHGGGARWDMLAGLSTQLGWVRGVRRAGVCRGTRRWRGRSGQGQPGAAHAWAPGVAGLYDFPSAGWLAGCKTWVGEGGGRGVQCSGGGGSDVWRRARCAAVAACCADVAACFADMAACCVARMLFMCTSDRTPWRRAMSVVDETRRGAHLLWKELCTYCKRMVKRWLGHRDVFLVIAVEV